MKKKNLCVWCINGSKSHGMNIYVGDPIEAKCDECGEDDDVYECVEEE